LSLNHLQPCKPDPISHFQNLREEYPEVEWREMATTRNRLIHEYFSVDFELIWDIVANTPPTLQQQIEHILSQEEY